MWAKPHEWNIGAATMWVRRVRMGTASRNAMIASVGVDGGRRAPLGVPVVPDVRMIWRPGPGGAGGSSSEPVGRASMHGTPAWATRSANSGSWMSALAPSRCMTSAS